MATPAPREEECAVKTATTAPREEESAVHGNAAEESVDAQRVPSADAPIAAAPPDEGAGQGRGKAPVSCGTAVGARAVAGQFSEAQRRERQRILAEMVALTDDEQWASARATAQALQALVSLRE